MRLTNCVGSHHYRRPIHSLCTAWSAGYCAAFFSICLVGLSLKSFFLFLPFPWFVFSFSIFSFSQSHSARIAVLCPPRGRSGLRFLHECLVSYSLPRSTETNTRSSTQTCIYILSGRTVYWQRSICAVLCIRLLTTCAHPLLLCPIPCFHLPPANQPPVRFCKSPLSSQSCLFSSSAGIQLFRRSTIRRGVIRRAIKRRNKFSSALGLRR